MNKKYTALLSVVLGSLVFQANAQIEPELISAFSRCDSHFFRQLQLTPIKGIDPTLMGSNKEFSWIRVADRAVTEKSRTTLPSGITLAGMPVLQYLDDVIDLDALGLYYTWAFVVDSTVENVYRNLARHIEQGQRLKKDGASYVRVETKTGTNPWSYTAPINQAVGLAKTERVFLIEEDGIPNRTLISCSLQGHITPQILLESRPDIPESEFPKIKQK